jgi:hypothetical protein
MTRGFTLIETIVYLALLSFIIACSFEFLASAGALAAAEASAANTASEGDFAIEKIEYVLAHDSDARLSIEGGALMLEEHGESAPLTSPNVVASELRIRPVTDKEGREVATKTEFLINGTLFTAITESEP